VNAVVARFIGDLLRQPKGERVLPPFPCYVQGQQVTTEAKDCTAPKDAAKKEQLAVVLRVWCCFPYSWWGGHSRRWPERGRHRQAQG
jgi:hypothetical protein